MSYTEQEKFHINRLEGRLETPDVIAAFHLLMKWAENETRLFVYPLSRGAFSAIHLSTKSHARKYADCEFGFEGAKSHMRWWFRTPCFENGKFSQLSVSKSFESHFTKQSEVVTDLATYEDVRKLCKYVTRHL